MTNITRKTTNHIKKIIIRLVLPDMLPANMCTPRSKLNIKPNSGENRAPL